MTAVRSPDTAELQHAASRKSYAAGVLVGKSLIHCAARADGTVRCARSEGAPESSDVRPADMSDAQRRTNAAWMRQQLAEMAGFIEGSVRNGKAHRWPLDRVATALRAIEAGDDRWREVEP